MRYSLFITVITGFLVMTLSYQSPIKSSAQSVKLFVKADSFTPNKTATVYLVDTILVDSLEHYKVSISKLRRHCRKGIVMIKEQQGVMTKQLDTLDGLIIKNE